MGAGYAGQKGEAQGGPALMRESVTPAGQLRAGDTLW